MFPNARDSLRRWRSESITTNGRRTGTTTTAVNAPPIIPVAVVLHNCIQLQRQPQQQQPAFFKESSLQRNEDNTGDGDEESPMMTTKAAGQEPQPDSLNEATTTESLPSSSTTANSTNWRYHPEHTMDLLPLLHLEISVTLPTTSSSDDDDKEEHDEVTVIYSETLERRSVHPSWEHLDQKLQLQRQWLDDDDVNHKTATISSSMRSSSSSSLWSNHELYKSMRLKLFFVTTVAQNEHETDNNNSSSPLLSSSSSDDEVQPERLNNIHHSHTTSKQQQLVDFLEAPLHPSFLQRIDVKSAATLSDDDGNGGGNNKDNNDNNGGDDEDDHLFLDNNTLPPLPPNALLVHYSDGSVRCLPYIHQLLVSEYQQQQQQQQSTAATATATSQSQRLSTTTTTTTKTTTLEDFSRFEDDVFSTLDNVTASIPQRRERTASSLLDQEEGAGGVPIIGGVSNDKAESDEMAVLQREMEQKLKLRETIQNGEYFLTEDQVQDVDLEANKEALSRQIEEEERLLAEEMKSFRQEQADLADLVQELKQMDDEVTLLHDEVQSQSLGLRQDQITKQAQSIKLVRDLQVVYPITLDSAATTSSSMPLSIIGNSNNRGTAGGYLIRGLRLPVDIYTTTVPEEEINASLGYCSHLVYMIAKYLAIQLRHRIFCNSSRSAIQQDGVGVFPLFLGRMVARSLEREQVDRGARLLGANVNCILMHLNLPESLQQIHVLARLQVILKFVATGNLLVDKLQRVKSSDSVASTSRQ